MCGIFCEIINSESLTSKDENVLQRIKNRGPDYFKIINYFVNDKIRLFFCSSVLWMQGQRLTEQPLENEKGILLFNGDIFDESWDKNLSDTQAIMNMFSKAHATDDHLIAEIKKLKGPFSLLYYDKIMQNLYFTRDHIGRNTLVIYKSNSSVTISSVLARKYPCLEIPATHIQKLNLLNNEITLYQWQARNTNPQVYFIDDWLQLVLKQQNLCDEDFILDVDIERNLIDEDNVAKYIENISQEYHLNKCKSTLFKRLLDNAVVLDTVQRLSGLLDKSVKTRLETQPLKCKMCINVCSTCSHSATGILFSGGLDCTILALLADKYVPKNQSIDLLNVAFTTGKNTSFDVPDRLTGRQSYEELKNICKKRQWIFREINVSSEKLMEYQNAVIGDLVFPRRTVLDESLGSALWFAALGQDDYEKSPSRVLLVGSGADELFGGYIRHRNALKRQGWSGLSKELLLDWKRISFRNLARDNRVICDHGRQPRMPYLDEDFVDFVMKLKPWLRCFPTPNLEVGIGDKLILRLLASYLGLTKVAILPKRALQFGSRIANSKQKGSDISKTFICYE